MDDDNLNSKNASHGVTPAATHVRRPTGPIAALAEFEVQQNNALAEFEVQQDNALAEFKVQQNNLFQQFVQQQPDRTAGLEKFKDERDLDRLQFSSEATVDTNDSGVTADLLQDLDAITVKYNQKRVENTASSQNNNQLKKSGLPSCTMVAGTNALKVPETVEASKHDISISPFRTPVSNRKRPYTSESGPTTANMDRYIHPAGAPNLLEAGSLKHDEGVTTDYDNIVLKDDEGITNDYDNHDQTEDSPSSPGLYDEAQAQEDVEDDEDQEEEPTDEVLRSHIKRLIPLVNLQNTGVKAFTKLLSKECGGADLKPRSKFIKQALSDAINAMDDSESDEDDSEFKDEKPAIHPTGAPNLLEGGSRQHVEGGTNDYDSIVLKDDEDITNDYDNHVQTEDSPSSPVAAPPVAAPSGGNAFLSAFSNSTGLSNEAVAAHRNGSNKSQGDASTRETITEGADALRKLAAAAANVPDLNKSPISEIFYDDFPNPTHNMLELQERQIDPDHLFHIAKIYAYRNFGITNLVWKEGARGTTRTYGCSKCDFRMRFDEVGKNTKKFILSKTISYEMWKDASHHQHMCQKHEISTSKTKVIKDTLIVLNHPDFLKAFKDLLGEDPIEAVHIKTDAISSSIGNEFNTKYNHNAIFSQQTWSKIVNSMIDILHRKAVLQYTFLPHFMRALIAKNKRVTAMLQTDVKGRFLRLFVGLPAALLVGKLTMPFYVADCFHYKCSTYDGSMFAIVSKNGYGESVLLAIAIIPIEKTRHLGWCIECCVRHGMTFIFPLFTDQGPLLATASAFQIQRAQSYWLQIHLNIRICVIHFIRSANHKNQVKAIEGIISRFVQKASRALGQLEFFCFILLMVKSIVVSIDDSAIINAVDVALYLLKVDPVHWCVFPNTPMFDQATFDTQLNDVISDLYFVRNIAIHSKSLLEVPDQDDPIQLNERINNFYTFCTIQTHKQLKDMKNNGSKKILKPKIPLRGFWNWTTNIVEGASLATKSIGARYEAPHSSIKNVMEYAANQTRKLTESISNSLSKGNFITEIGYNIAEGIEKQESVNEIISIETDLAEDIDCADDGDTSTIKSIRCLMKGIDSAWTTTVTYGHTLSPSIRSTCERHIMMHDISCPCKCFGYIFEKSKTVFSVGGATIPNFAPEHTVFGNQLFHHVFPRCFQVDRQMRDDSLSAHISVPTSHEASHSYHSVAPVDLMGKSVQATQMLMVPPKSTSKFWIDTKRIPSLGERGGYAVRGRKKRKGGNRESVGRHFCQLSLAMSRRNGVKPTTGIINIHARSTDIAKVDKNKRKRHCCRHCGIEGHYIAECELFHTFGQGIVSDDHPSMSQSVYLVYHAPNNVSIEYLLFKDELAKPPGVEMVAPSKVTGAKEDDDFLFLPSILPEHEIQQSLALGRLPKKNKKKQLNKHKKKSLEDRLLSVENAYSPMPNDLTTTDIYGRHVNIIELRTEFKNRKQNRTLYVQVGAFISTCNKAQLSNELFKVRAHEKSNDVSILAIDIIDAPTAVSPPEPEQPLTQLDSYTGSNENYIANVATCVSSRSTVPESSLSSDFVSEMLNFIPILRDSFTLDNKIPMECRTFNPLSQESMGGHEGIACTPHTQLDNILSTQEVYPDSEDVVVKPEFKNYDCVLDEPDADLISMYSIPLLYCSDGKNSYLGTQHHCHILCDLRDDHPEFVFKRVRSNNDNSAVITYTKTPFASSLIEFAPNTNPPFFRIQHAKGKTKFFTLFFSKVHIGTAYQMVKNIGPSKFKDMASPQIFIDLVPSTVVESKSSHGETIDNVNIILKKGQQMLFYYPFPASKLSLNNVTTGLFEYFTEFPFDNPLIEPSAAYNKKGRLSFTPSRSDSTVSGIVSHLHNYNGLSAEWLTDTHLDFYMLWLSRNCGKDIDAYFLPTSMYEMIELQGPVKVVEHLKERNINLNAKVIFVPVCKDGHWTLMVIVNHSDVDDYLRVKESKESRSPSDSFPCFLYFNSSGGHNIGKPFRKQLLKLLGAWREDQNQQIGSRNVDYASNPFVDNHVKIMPLCEIKGVYS